MTREVDHFHEALAFVLKNEGGWYAGTEARDPNPTNFGVIQKTYDEYRERKGLPKRTVRLIEESEVVEIYREYWDAAHCGDLPRRTAITVFDHAINAGPKAAINCLQRALGVTADGVFGPITRRAVDNAVDTGLALNVCMERLDHYTRIAQAQRLRPNLYSWVSRVLRFRGEYL